MQRRKLTALARFNRLKNKKWSEALDFYEISVDVLQYELQQICNSYLSFIMQKFLTYSKSPQEGYIYFATCTKNPAYIKIGKTKNNPEKRIKSSQTFSFEDWKIDFSVFISDIAYGEKVLHDYYKNFRFITEKGRKTEIFKINNECFEEAYIIFKGLKLLKEPESNSFDTEILKLAQKIISLNFGKKYWNTYHKLTSLGFLYQPGTTQFFNRKEKTCYILCQKTNKLIKNEALERASQTD